MGSPTRTTDGDADRVGTAVADLLAAHPDPAADPVAFLGDRFDRGLTWVHFPVSVLGLPPEPRADRDRPWTS